MRKWFRGTAVLLIGALTALAQADLTTLQVEVVLIDRELNLKPVPKFTVQLTALSGASTGEKISLVTGFDGRATVELPAGRYQLATPKPIEFQGNRYSWDLELTLSGAEQKLELSNNNAMVAEVAPKPATPTAMSPVELFQRYQNSVVTVWSEFGHGTGFFAEASGLVLTNQHVVGPSRYLSVQFDAVRKVRAILLASDADKDVAVLWINSQAFPEAVVPPLADGQGEKATIAVGERVFTIGSPLSQRKILTTGIVSGVEERAILADLSINPGNSGGPLFDSQGVVIGLTTFREQARIGPGIAGIIRIEEAWPLLEQARQKIRGREPPSRALLLVEPTLAFPLEAIQQAVARENYDTQPYFFSKGKFDVAILTPPLIYYLSEGSTRAALQEKEKRTRKQEGEESVVNPLQELRGWREYLGHYQAVIMVRARPQLRETFWSSFSRGMAQGAGQAKFRFRTDFHKMRLLCGEQEVMPIHPGKIAHVINEKNQFVNAVDATYEGIYTYPPDAISPDCRGVRLELYSEKEPEKAEIKELSPDVVRRIHSDFEPYSRAWEKQRQ
jgi:S1-C subfamily serine protease